MDKSTVDIIVITYNQESLIEETLDSILNQTYDNINQIIVTDDGSIDRTPNIISMNSISSKYLINKTEITFH